MKTKIVEMCYYRRYSRILAFIKKRFADLRYYDFDTTAVTNSFIQITSYNSSKAEIEGVFSVALVLAFDDNEGPTPPDNLIFTNGKFTTKVERKWFE